MTANIPANLCYSDTHQWVAIEGDAATVGITAYATKALGAIVWLELPEKGAKVEEGASLGSAESVKAAGDIISPVTGVVEERNSAAIDNPKLCNDEPYGEGWLVKVRLSKKPKNLMDGKAYAGLCERLQKENGE